jgi:hypothetical protein
VAINFKNNINDLPGKLVVLQTFKMINNSKNKKIAF